MGLVLPGWGSRLSGTGIWWWVGACWDRLVSLGVPGWDDGFGAAGTGQWVRGCRAVAAHR